MPNNDPIQRWFAGLIERKFQEAVGLSDPSLLDYLAGLLTEFIHVERINLLRDGSGRPVEDLAGILTEMQAGTVLTDEERRREYHRHIGDFSLFWTGVYPENLRHLKRRNARDGLLDYFEQGKRSYAIASRLTQSDMQPPASVLQQLSDQFEYCVYGLGLVRQQWEKPGPEGFDAEGLMLK